MFTKCIAAVLISTTALLASPGRADTFASRPITLVVPYTPGGSSDILARALAEQLRTSLGQAVIVENKPGAGTTIASDYVARTEPDGYTLLFAGTSFTMAPALVDVKYDPVKDFDAVSQVLSLGMFLVVQKDLPVQNIDDLIRYAKAHPGKLNYGSSGSGSVSHFQMELFKTLAGIDIVHVPYKGAAPALTDLLGGQLQLTFDGLASVGPHLKSGALRPLAVALPHRSSQYAGVPTVAEAGLPGYEATAWVGVLAPAGTPPDTIAKLNRAVVAAVQDKGFRARVTELGGEPGSSTPAEFASLIKTGSARWSEMARQMNLK